MIMAYKGDTTKYRISTDTGSWRTVGTWDEVKREIEKIKSYNRTKWIAVDEIKTTRLVHELLKGE